MEFFTIGVFNSTEQEYFKKLSDNHVDTFCDIRQRRGVRGSEYSFVNSIYLQSKLNEQGIKYVHIIELAPTREIRELQKKADNELGEHKRDRNQLGKVFATAYRNIILSKFDFENFIEKLKEVGANHVVLFCVEEKHEACHRSIVAEKLEKLGYNITHL